MSTGVINRDAQRDDDDVIGLLAEASADQRTMGRATTLGYCRRQSFVLRRASGLQASVSAGWLERPRASRGRRPARMSSARRTEAVGAIHLLPTGRRAVSSSPRERRHRAHDSCRRCQQLAAELQMERIMREAVDGSIYRHRRSWSLIACSITSIPSCPISSGTETRTRWRPERIGLGVSFRWNVDERGVDIEPGVFGRSHGVERAVRATSVGNPSRSDLKDLWLRHCVGRSHGATFLHDERNLE